MKKVYDIESLNVTKELIIFLDWCKIIEAPHFVDTSNCYFLHTRSIKIKYLRLCTSKLAEQVIVTWFPSVTRQEYCPLSPLWTPESSRENTFSLAVILALSAILPSKGLLSFSHEAVHPLAPVSVAQLKTAFSPAKNEITHDYSFYLK